MEIAVRRAEPEDYEGVWRTMKDEEAYAGLLQVPFPSKEAWRRRMAEPVEGDFFLVACVDGEIVGNAGLHAAAKSPRRAHAMHVGMAVHRDWQGKGVGTALMRAICGLADGWLHVIRLELTVYTDNARAIALYRKFGFEVEGTHRAFALRGGKYVDTHAMARVRPKPPI